MPNIKSAKKRVRVIAAKTEQNKSIKSELKTLVKKAEAAVAGDNADKETAVRLALKKIDQAASKGVIHSNTAARKKSGLAKKITAAK